MLDLLRFRRLLLPCLALSLLAAGALAGAEEPALPEQPVKPKPPPLRIEKPEHPFHLPEGPCGAAWQQLLANALPEAEQAFRALLEKTPGHLETLEGLRACLIAQGLYTEVQRVNIQMIAAAAESPLSIAFAMRAMEHLAYAESRVELIACLQKSAAAAAPATRVALQDLLASLHMSADRMEEAKRALQGLGYVERWLLVAGPFGVRDRNNPMERRFAPERPLKALTFKDERGKDVVARKDLPVSFRSLNLGRLYPGERGIFYAFTNLESDRDQEVLLLAGAPHGSRIYLRGLPILRPNQERQYERDTPILRTKLLKGHNPLLAKLPFAGELALRVLAPDYSAAAGVAVKDLEPAALAGHEVLPIRGFLFSQELHGALAEHFLRGLKSEERAAGKGLAELAGNGSLSVAMAPWLDLAAQQENDVPAREAIARTLAGSFPDAVGPLDTSAVILGAAGRSARQTESRNTEEARQLRERALEKLPQSHQHLLGLYFFYAEHDLKEQAFEKLKACAEAHPKSGLAQERLGQEYLNKGLTVQAQRQFEKAAALDAAYLPALGRFLEQHGDRTRAREIRKKLQSLGMEAPLLQFHHLLAARRLEEAEKILSAQEQAFPERAEEFMELRAALKEEQGDGPGAWAILKKLVAAQPKNREALADLVDLSLRMHKDEEARQLLRAYLREHPGDYEFRRRLREQEGQEPRAWWEPYDLQVRAIDTSKFNQDNYPNAKHAWIVDFMVTKVFPDLSRESYVHIAQKVLNLEGIGELSEVLVQAQRQDLVFIRTLNSDGSTYQPQNVHNFNLAQSASFLKVEPGSILEHAYLTNEDADEDEPALSMAFNFMALDAPRAISRWVVMLPKNHTLEIRKIRPELIEEKILPGPDGYTVYQWTNKEVEGIKVEPHMPNEGEEEVIPLVFVESRERPHRATSWLLREKKTFLPAPAQAQAKALAAARRSEEERFRAIAGWVSENIQPGQEARTLEDVWALRSGNTAQMTELAAAMGRAAGLNVRQALVNGAYIPGQAWRTKHARRLWDPGHFSSFGSGGHMLVLEPQQGADVWVQYVGQTPKYFSADDLYWPQPGALALLSSEEGISIKRVRGESLGKVIMGQRVAVSLDEHGAGNVHGSVQLFGLIGGQVRNMLSDPRQSQKVREGLPQSLWDKKIEQIQATVEQEGRTDRPLRLVYSCVVNELAAPAEKAFCLQPYRQQALLLQLMGTPERVHDLVLRREVEELDQAVRYEAPPGYAWIEVPDDLFICTEFGFYLADFNVQGRTLTCSRSFLMPAQRVSPQQYPRLMEFLRKISHVERQRIAYGRADFAGLGALARPVPSLGYASHGGDPEEKSVEEPDVKVEQKADPPFSQENRIIPGPKKNE